MTIRLCDILQRVAFNGKERKHLLVVTSWTQQPNDATQAESPFAKVFNGACGPLFSLPDDEHFVEHLVTLLDEQKPDDVFVWPPIRGKRKLSNEFQERYPGLGIEEVVLQTLEGKLASDARIAAMLPTNFFFGESSRGFRERFFSANTLKFAFTPDFDLRLLGMQEIHAAFRMGCVVVHVGSTDPSLRVIRIASPEPGQASFIEDLESLVRRRSGHTQYGYIIQEGLAPGMPISYDLYSPAFRLKQENLGQMGGTAALLDLVDIVRGLHTTAEAKNLVEADTRQGVPLLDGRSIGVDGQFNLDSIRYRIVDPPDRYILKNGDICIPSIQPDRRTLKVAVVHEKDLPAAISHTVITLRPKQTTSLEQLQILQAYLRSPQAAEDMAALGPYLQLNNSTLSSLNVPIPDEALGIAIRSLDRSIQQFRHWAEEATRAKDSLFTFASISESRAQILTLGRMTRRRIDAAGLVDDLRYRVRALFPHPVAFRWRTVESSFPDLEGYQIVLECAENLVSYLAALIVLHSRLIEGASLPSLRQLGEKLRQNPSHGISMGDWVNIIRQAAQSKPLRAASPTTPFFEAADFLRTNKMADEAIQLLSKRRNDHAHGRGPKGQAIAEAFAEAMSTLQQLLSSVEFLAEYPLHYVESTRRDSMQKLTRYSFRKMMGDHPLVHIEEAEGDYPEMEAGSLYVIDRSGRPHLARPFLVMRTCPVCHTRSTFMLEKFDAKSETCTLKSLEHGHGIDDAEIAEAYRFVGFL